MTGSSLHIRKRPLLVLTCFYGLGIIFGFYFKGSLWWLILGGLTFLVNLIYFIRKGKLQSTLFLLCFVFFGALWYNLHCLPPDSYRHWLDEVVEGQGTVISYPRPGAAGLSFMVDLHRLSRGEQELPGGIRVLLRTKGDAQVLPGTVVGVRGKLSLPRQARNPGEFDYRQYLANGQIFYQLTTQDNGLTVISEGQGVRTWLAREREKIASHLAQIIPLKERGLLLGVLFGDKSGIPDTDYEAYQRAGVVHLFAVSGLHVGFVLGLVWALLSFWEVRPLFRLLLGAGCLTVYFFLVGWTASIVRAIIMALVGLVALTVGKKQDLYTTLALAALIILVANPGELLQTGFQLSFVTTAGLIYLTPWLGNLGLGKILAPAVAAQLAGIPLGAYYFNQISLVAPFLNIIAVGAGGIIVGLAMIGSILYFVWPPLGDPFFLGAGGLLYALSEFILWWGRQEWTGLIVPTPPLALIVILYAFLFLAPHLYNFIPYWRSFFPPVYRQRILTAFIIIGITCFLWPHMGKTQVVFLDVGQGDSIFIKTPGGKTILLDGGGTPGSDYSIGKQVLKPFLRRQGLRKIDLVIMSHSDTDHSEGLLEVIPYFNVGQIIVPPLEQGDKVEEALLQVARKRNIPLNSVTAGQYIQVDDQVRLEVLHPDGERIWHGNNKSLVLKLIYQEAEWLLTGDIENEAIAYLLAQKEDLRADILKLPHHGSISSYSEEFYRQVGPWAVIVSAGINKFNHPHPRVRGYFSERGIPFYLTRDNGAIITWSKGRKIEARTFIPSL
ncbi:DNA internalization-related competence protein ComEC/Rec2 [Thermanaerosceptrum fracticalcis]|uniref:DNA internalization-related competence protein ComEC/Rec2 n=1 Tax=Thermanaerosceptrum fracticalcis TaxID=1712410 RepID=A0A7G6E276_THEFR|nr:DNA internalization-related competence protein ComEC/Rec2 [Thermanaerosceptrum fracticalcis]